MSATEGEGRFDLPGLAEIFGELSRGRHLCAEDGRLYHELQEHEAAFEELFDRLGYRLQADERGFYYFQAQETQSVSGQTRRSAVFFLILVEALWADEGGAEPLEDLVMERSWSIADLPHLGRERYVEIMEQLDRTPDEDLLRDEVKRLVRFGFAAWNDDERFRFRAPALRFLDIAREVAEGLHAEAADEVPVREVQA
ncbi:condensin complex protein MksE [Aquisalimonas asiatica]|uniref:DUF4194 domain-containing protein n=1 Tax=Aquisalimonas asiatica TaxID=406100 RepID=A0A1H8TI87_9GAMM|nr:hypothetical protein [Aquisalimonas asiatica]SEO90810.1 hypothetical protein SAMN04488052_104225 [Aquisalimonas asiatica]